MNTENATLQNRFLVDGTLVLKIEENLVQVGTNPEHTVVFSGLDDEEVAWLESLRDRPRARKIPRVGSKEVLTERQLEALRLLDMAGLLHTGPAPLSRLKVCVLGLDDVGIRIARLLAEANVRHLEVRDSRPIDATCEAHFPAASKGMPRENATRQMIREIAPEAYLGKIACPDVVIVCSQRIVDFGVLGTLLSNDTPHLPVVSDHRSISIGPLVLPGKTACTLCSELWLRDEVPGMTHYSEALGRCGSSPSVPYISSMAAGAAVSAIAAVANGTIGTLWEQLVPPTAESKRKMEKSGIAASPLLRVTAAGLDVEPCLPHIECGCIRIPDRFATTS